MSGFAFVLAIIFGAVVIPVVFGILGDVSKRYMKLKERQLELASSQAAEKAAQYAAQTERLEQRVRVLERIVTDRGLTLAEEIGRLEEKPLN